MAGGGPILYGDPVEWGHPLNRGLAAWWLPLPGRAGGGTLFDLAGRAPATLTNGPTWGAGADGFAAVSFDGVNDVVTAPLAAAAVSGGYTFLVRCASTVAAGGSTSQWVLNYGAGNENVEILWGHVSLGYRGAFMMSGGGGYPKVNFLTLPAAGQWVTLGVSWDGSSIAGYLDGVSQGTAACGAFGTPAAETLAVGAGNATGSGSQPWPGLIESVLAFRRPLSAADHAGWHRQFRAGLPDTLRRYTPRVWLVPDPGGGGGVTGDAAGTQAADAGSAAGTVLVSGSASATQAAQTGTSAGAVAVAGAGSATQAAQTGSAAGAVPVAGAGSATQGSQTGAAAGTVAIAGAASQTQTAQTGAGAGTVLVTGAAPQTQAADTGSAAGLVVNGPVGDGAATQAAQTGAAAGAVLVTGAGTVTQAAQTGTAAGTVAGGSPITGAGAVTQAAHVGSGSGFLGDEPPAGRRDVFRSRVFGSSVFGGPAA